MPAGFRRGNGRAPAVCAARSPPMMSGRLNGAWLANGQPWPADSLRGKSAIVCPVCAVSQGRKLEHRLQEVVAATVAAGDSVGVQTLTLGHDRGHELPPLRGEVIEVSRRVASGRGWVKLKRLSELMPVRGRPRSATGTP